MEPAPELLLSTVAFSSLWASSLTKTERGILTAGKSRGLKKADNETTKAQKPGRYSLQEQRILAVAPEVGAPLWHNTGDSSYNSEFTCSYPEEDYILLDNSCLGSRHILDGESKYKTFSSPKVWEFVKVILENPIFKTKDVSKCSSSLHSSSCLFKPFHIHLF